MPKEFTTEQGRLRVRKVYDAKRDQAPWGLHYGTRKDGIRVELEGYYATEQARDAKYAALTPDQAAAILTRISAFLTHNSR